MYDLHHDICNMAEKQFFFLYYLSEIDNSIYKMYPDIKHIQILNPAIVLVKIQLFIFIANVFEKQKERKKERQKAISWEEPRIRPRAPFGTKSSAQLRDHPQTPGAQRPEAGTVVRQQPEGPSARRRESMNGSTEVPPPSCKREMQPISMFMKLISKSYILLE